MVAMMMAVHWGGADHQGKLYHIKRRHREDENVSNVLVTPYDFTYDGDSPTILECNAYSGAACLRNTVPQCVPIQESYGGPTGCGESNFIECKSLHLKQKVLAVTRKWSCIDMSRVTAAWNLKTAISRHRFRTSRSTVSREKLSSACAPGRAVERSGAVLHTQVPEIA